VLQRSNGFLIAGSNEQDIGFDCTVDPTICEDIHRRAARLFPQLGHATPVKRWIGFRPRLVEGDGPRIGRVEGTNVWLAYGHYRNGILLTPVTAQRIADDISVLPSA
jgi:glycine oxidase